MMKNHFRDIKQPITYQLGQAMVEMTVIMFVVFLLLFGIIQFGLIYNAKIVLNYATFEAARAGSLNYGSPRAINYALARGLAPLESTDSGITDYDRFQQSTNKMIDLVEVGDFSCVQRISPSTSSQHWVPDPAAGAGYNNYIPNDHLVYRSAAPKGGVSVQDANLLKIRVTYCHKIIVPFIATTIKRLMLDSYAATDPDPLDSWTVPTRGNFTKVCYENDRIPIESQAVIRMQTPIRDYAFTSNCS